MFCDLVGSTALGEQLDPEILRHLLAAYHETCSAVIAELEGHVAQLLGDGVLAYFGYPHAHEYDAERAVRAALLIVTRLDEINPRLEREHGRRLAVRIGIHTGPVVVGELGGGQHTERLALGHTVNVASRLQNAAKPGSVLISAETLRLVRGLFVIEDLGPHSLAGIGEPVTAYQVLQPIRSCS